MPANQGLMAVSQQMFAWIDHVPARLTAFGFAVVGNFEEAINAWRRDAALWKHANEGVILASAAGAVVAAGGAVAPAVGVVACAVRTVKVKLPSSTSPSASETATHSTV